MANKKIYMGLSKVAITTIMVSSLTGVAHAADGDIYDMTTTTPTTHGSISNVILHDQATLMKMITGMKNYGYEVASKIYGLVDVNNDYNSNSNFTPAQLQADVKAKLTSIANVPTTTTATVSSVATITVPATTAGTVPTLPTTVTVTLSDGTTKTANITWNAAATTAATYATAGTVTINGTLAAYNNYAVSASVTVNAGALAVTSVNAIDANHVAVVFNTAVDPTKVAVTNFSIVDKNNQPAGAVTGATVSTDGKTVTLTTSGLNQSSAPYTLMVNPNAITLASQSLPITVATTAPTVSSVTVTNATTLTVAYSTAVADNTTGAIGTSAATYFTVKDLTDSTKTVTVSAGNINASGNLVLTTSALIASHNYSVAIAKNTVVDAFGNQNAASTNNFSVQGNTTVPAMTSVQYVQSTKTPANIDAIVTFNEPVVQVGGTAASIQDIAAYTTTADNATNTLLDSTATAATQTAEVTGLTLASNQVLVESVNSGVTMLAGKQYGLVLPANTVKDATISGVQNAITSAIATNSVDLVAASLKTVVLNSNNSVTLTFSKAVTYDTTKTITLPGFKVADGSAATVNATVAMSSDGKSATLTPASGYIFETAMAAIDLNVTTGAFVDAAKNTSTFTNATGATITDTAAPVVVSTKVTTPGAINVTFSESVSPVTGATLKALVNGVSDNFTVAGSTITITGTGFNTAGGDQVTITSGLLQDAATTPNVNAAISTVSTK